MLRGGVEWAVSTFSGVQCGGKIRFTTPPPSSFAEDWATVGVRWYRGEGDGGDDGGGRWYRGNGDGWSGGEYIFGWPLCGGKIRFLPLPPHSVAENWATVGVRRYWNDRDGLGDGSKQIYRDDEHRLCDGGRTEIDYTTASIYSTDQRTHRLPYLILYLILSYHTTNYTLYIPIFWSYSRFLKLCGSMQLRWSSWLGSIISSHPLSMHLEPEPLFLMNSFWMPREVRQHVDDGLAVL